MDDPTLTPMRADEVKDLLNAVKEGRVTPEEAVASLQDLPVDDLGFARLDTHRELRQRLPESIYAEGKTAEQTVDIAERMLASTTGPVLATRVPSATAAALLERWPEADHHEIAGVVTLRIEPGEPRGLVAVVAAGTSDLPVAEEASVVAEACGLKVERVTDVGVAGLHRILAARAPLDEADVVIVVAGMEGALPSIVGGLTATPVVAVPTSVGYGSSFEGLSALLGMLNSCAAGVVVCNIDNGFGAAMFALRVVNAASATSRTESRR
jgi:pyridinium-3,5-biscarboxylic acid mononucleotide synthase